MRKQHLISLQARKEIAPKITSTKTTISRSTPFLIKKHHLDDTEMKQALHYQNYIDSDKTIANRTGKTYSFQGQNILCVRSSQQKSHQDHQKSRKESQTDARQMEPVNPQINVRGEYYQSSHKKEQESAAIMQGQAYLRQIKERQSIKANNDYELKKMMKVTKQLKKEADQLKQLYEEKVETDLKMNGELGVEELQKEINLLKMKNLQIEKQHLQDELVRKESRRKDEPKASKRSRCQKNGQSKREKDLNNESSSKFMQVTRKPRFRYNSNPDTDNSFSSFSS